MPKTNTSSDYWRGYRAARIYALMNAIDEYESVEDYIETGESEAFLTGFYAGVQALRTELNKLIAHERALEKKECNNGQG